MNSKERHEKRYQRRKAKREARKIELNRQHGDFDKIMSFDNLYTAYQKCCKGVNWKASTQRYRVNALLNVNNAHRRLQEGRYKSGGFVEFYITERGKRRHIKSVHINERVIQRCLCDFALIPMLAPTFIYDNTACLKYKGIDFAIRRLTCHMQRHYRKHGTEGYALVIDFSKYFDRIQHKPIFDELDRRFTDKRIVNLAREFIKDFGDGMSLGLGSQVSQVMALAYPNKLDHFIKSVLRIKHYARYMDDSYLIHPSKEYLQHCLAEITKICDSLGIVLNPRKTQIVKLSRGITFLKTRFNLTDTGKIIKRPNKRSIVVMRRKLKTFRRWVDRGQIEFADVKISYQSWKGHVGRRSAYHTTQNMDALFYRLFEVEIHGGILKL